MERTRPNKRSKSCFTVLVSLNNHKAVTVMKPSEKEVTEILKAYPKGMSKDQFYKVAHISKATALYLLQSGLVPCNDSGKQTRRYRIKTEDVLVYLNDRDADPYKYEPPTGWYSARSSRRKPEDPIEARLKTLDDNQRILLKEYFTEMLAEYDDLITAEQVSVFLGYAKSTSVEWCDKRRIKSFFISGRYLIPKLSLIVFLSSEESFRIHRKSTVHTEMLMGFFTKINEN